MQITNFKLRITNARFWICNSLFFCLLFVFSTNVFAQNLETLTQMLERGNDEQKRDALLQIRTLENAEASRIAIPSLKDSSEIVRATAVSSIIFLPKDESVLSLLPLLADKSPFVRRETAYALGKVGDVNSVKSLLQLFQTDKVLEVKAAAIVALGEIGDISAVANLQAVLQRKTTSKEAFLKRSAARSIGQIAQIIQTGEREVITPETFTGAENKIAEKRKYKNLSEEFPIFQSVVKTLIRVMQSKDESGDAKRESAFALGAIGDETAMPILQSYLNDKDNYLAQICREAILKIESEN